MLASNDPHDDAAVMLSGDLGVISVMGLDDIIGTIRGGGLDPWADPTTIARLAAVAAWVEADSPIESIIAVDAPGMKRHMASQRQPAVRSRRECVTVME